MENPMSNVLSAATKFAQAQYQIEAANGSQSQRPVDPQSLLMRRQFLDVQLAGNIEIAILEYALAG